MCIHTTCVGGSLTNSDMSKPPFFNPNRCARPASRARPHDSRCLVSICDVHTRSEWTESDAHVGRKIDVAWRSVVLEEAADNIPPFGPRPSDVNRGEGLDLSERGGDGTGTGGDDGFRGLRGDCSNRVAVCFILKMCRIEARTAALW